MNGPPGTTPRPLLAAGVSAALVLALSFSAWWRSSLLPSELQYIPPESSLIVAGGRIDALWRDIDTHFGPDIRARHEQSPLFSGLTKTADDYQKKGVPVDSVAALQRYGIDTARGFLYSIYSDSDEDAQYLLVVPVTDPAKFRTFVARALAARGIVSQDIGKGQTVQVVGDTHVFALPEPGIALVSNSIALMRRSILNRDRNVTQIKNNDAFYEGVRRLARDRLLHTATTFLSWQPQGAPALQGAMASVRFSDQVV